MFQRSCTPISLAITATLATTPPFSFGNFAGGQVYVPANSSLTTLTWYSAATADGTFTPVQDGASTPAAVTSTVTPSTTGCNCKIPADCFACAFLKVVGNAAETIGLSLKS